MSLTCKYCHDCELQGWGLVQAYRVRRVWAGCCTTDEMVLASTTFPRGLCHHSSIGTRISGRSGVEIYRRMQYERTREEMGGQLERGGFICWAWDEEHISYTESSAEVGTEFYCNGDIWR